MRDNHRGACVPGALHRGGRAVVHRDEPLEADGDRVAGAVGVAVVVGELQAGHE
jgi:hypothetical protein